MYRFYTANYTTSTGLFTFYWSFLKWRLNLLDLLKHPLEVFRKKGVLRNTCCHFQKFLKNYCKVAKWNCGQNTWKNSVRKFSFSKFAGFQHVTWLKMNYFTNIVQGFWSYIPDHLFFQTALTGCFRFDYICTFYREIITLQLVSFTILIWRSHQK